MEFQFPGTIEDALYDFGVRSYIIVRANNLEQVTFLGIADDYNVQRWAEYYPEGNVPDDGPWFLKFSIPRNVLPCCMSSELLPRHVADTRLQSPLQLCQAQRKELPFTVSHAVLDRLEILDMTVDEVLELYGVSEYLVEQYAHRMIYRGLISHAAYYDTPAYVNISVTTETGKIRSIVPVRVRNL